jgi:hypothetical protein
MEKLVERKSDLDLNSGWLFKEEGIGGKKKGCCINVIGIE